MAVTIDKYSGSTNAVYDNVKETFPVSVSGAGTVAVSGIDINGTTTTFLSVFQKGDFIWLKDNDELRRIENIVSDTKMTLEHPGTTDASTTYGVVTRTPYKEISILIDSAAAAEINGIERPSNTSDSFKSNKKFIPTLIDSTVNANKVYVTAK